MKVEHLKDFVRGWFIGGFEPTVFKTEAVEVGVREYRAGDYEGFHHHKIATEITVIIEGEVKMNGETYYAGDIIVTEPNEGTDFLAVTDARNVVVKIPGALDDKYTE